MNAPHVVYVEGNVKGGVRAALGPKTLIVGPNGTGKSAVCNCIELAATGRVSDILGRRDVAKEVELAALAPDRKGELMARVLLADGSEAIWRAGGKGGKKAKHAFPAVIDPLTVLPLRPVYDAITGNVETARKFFLQFAVGAVSDKDVLDRVPAALHPYYKRATLQSTLSTSTAVDRLLSALERAKKEARDAKARAKASDSASAESAQGLAPLPTEAEERALREALKEAEKKLDGMKKALAGAEALAQARASLAEAAARVAASRAALLRAEAEKEAAHLALAGIPPPPTIDPHVIATANAIRAHAETGRTDCLVCGASADPLVFQGRLEALTRYVTQVDEQSKAWNTANTKATLADATVAQASAEVQAAEAALAAVQAATGHVPEGLPTEEGLAVAQADVERLREAMRTIDVLKATWASSSKARDNAEEARNEAGEWTKLAEACVEAVAKLLDGGVEGFRARVAAYLPPADQFMLTMRDGERAVFQFGLSRNGVLHTALSGAEWARVTAALASACRDPNPNRVSIIIPEERAYDPHTLTLVMMAFGHIEESQVVLCSPVEPNVIPAGWTVINTVAEQHRNSDVPQVRDLARAWAAPVAGASGAASGAQTTKESAVTVHNGQGLTEGGAASVVPPDEPAKPVEIVGAETVAPTKPVIPLFA